MNVRRGRAMRVAACRWGPRTWPRGHRFGPRVETARLACLRADDAAEADMARGRIDRLALPGGRPVAQAVVRRAEMRAALDHLAWKPFPRQRLRRAAWRVGRLPVEPGGRPLPDVPRHVVEAVTVGREAPDRRGALVTVELQV